MKTLQARILGFFLALLLLVVGSTLATVYRATYTHAWHQVEDGLDQGRRILVDSLEARQRALRAAAETLAKDDALRQAIFADSEDRDSLIVALDNHRLRTEADVALLSELDGTVLVHTGSPELQEAPLAAARLREEAVAPSSPRLTAVGGELVQLVVVPYYVPVSAPEPTFWLLLGQRVDDDFARHLAELTGLDTAFVEGGGAARVVASSLDPELARSLAGADLGGAERARRVDLGAVEFVVSSTALPAVDGAAPTAFLLRPTREAFLDFRQLTAQILAITLVFVLLVILGAILIARGITRPLRTLGDAARRMARGDYAAELFVAGEGEVGVLAGELGRMQREIREREAAIQHLAYHDDLTGLPNRNRFRAELARAIEGADADRGRLAVAVIDLDRFKDINDTLGHHVGDRLLLEIGRRLEQIAGDEGLQVARLGGDEFGALYPGSSIAAVREAVGRIRRRLSEPVEADDIRLEVQASVGVSVFPDHGRDAATMLKKAEVAMYVAKERWLGTAFYESSEDRHSVHRLSLMSDLLKAVDGDGEGLHLGYQPKIDLATRRITQAEALVRWSHPTLGPVSPGEFVPIAEQTGAVRHITRWVLERVLDQLVAWRQGGLELEVAVNISARDLHDRELPGWLEGRLRERGLSAGSLVLEVTEGSVMADPETAKEVLDQLAAMGATISIDDFGTGYSSLAQLQRLPVHELKVDRSFVAEMGRADEARVIVRSTVELGHSLGLRVVGEGVESVEVLELLRELGCDLAQGYYVGKPLDPDELRERLESGRFPAAVVG